MALLKIKPFQDAPATTSGITFGVTDKKSGQGIRVGISAAAQTKYFGGLLTENDALEVNIDDDAGKNHLAKIGLTERDSADAIPFKTGIKGSVSVTLTPWCQIADGSRPAKAVDVVAQPSANAILVKLPEWARPPARKIGQGRSIMG